MFTVNGTIAQVGIKKLLSELSENTQKFDDIIQKQYEKCDAHEVKLVISTMMSCLYEWLGEYEKENEQIDG